MFVLSLVANYCFTFAGFDDDSNGVLVDSLPNVLTNKKTRVILDIVHTTEFKYFFCSGKPEKKKKKQESPLKISAHDFFVKGARMK